MSLEELILRHAVGLALDSLDRAVAAAGAMMIPIPARGILTGVSGEAGARGAPRVAGVEIAIARGRPVVALPEGDRYLGFIFARADTPADVERRCARPTRGSTSTSSELKPESRSEPASARCP